MGTRGVLLKTGDKYRLIDGYHRVLATDDTMLTMIVGE